MDKALVLKEDDDEQSPRTRLSLGDRDVAGVAHGDRVRDHTPVRETLEAGERAVPLRHVKSNDWYH